VEAFCLQSASFSKFERVSSAIMHRHEDIVAIAVLLATSMATQAEKISLL
jgi:hypothetical protein